MQETHVAEAGRRRQCERLSFLDDVDRQFRAGGIETLAETCQKTTLPLKGIARRVGLGTSQSANSYLHRWMQANPQAGNRSDGNQTNSGCTMNHPMG